MKLLSQDRERFQQIQGKLRILSEETSVFKMKKNRKHFLFKK